MSYYAYRREEMAWSMMLASYIISSTTLPAYKLRDSVYRAHGRGERERGRGEQ